MKFFLYFVGVCGILVMLAKEILEFGELRREGRLNLDAFKRVRRRTLAAFLLILLGAHLVSLSKVERILANDHQTLFAWYGLAFILVIWLVIIAVRDFRAEMQRALKETRDLTIESQKEIANILTKQREADDVPITQRQVQPDDPTQ